MTKLGLMLTYICMYDIIITLCTNNKRQKTLGDYFLLHAAQHMVRFDTDGIKT